MIMSNALILALMTFLFLFLGYSGVPVAFALMAGVLAGTMFTPISLPRSSVSCLTALIQKLMAAVLPRRQADDLGQRRLSHRQFVTSAGGPHTAARRSSPSSPCSSQACQATSHRCSGTDANHDRSRWRRRLSARVRRGTHRSINHSRWCRPTSWRSVRRHRQRLDRGAVSRRGRTGLHDRHRADDL